MLDSALVSVGPLTEEILLGARELVSTCTDQRVQYLDKCLIS
jgi:hypothetical protein